MSKKDGIGHGNANRHDGSHERFNIECGAGEIKNDQGTGKNRWHVGNDDKGNGKRLEASR